MKENDATFDWPQDSGRMGQHTVDIPGHGRLRWRLKDFVPVASAVVVLVDATAVSNPAYARDAAAMIWDVIYSQLRRGTKVIVACNKSDDIRAIAVKRIKALLEVQLSALARTRSKYPAYHDESDDGVASAEPVASAEQFTFEESSPVNVSFVVVSVKKGDLKQLYEAL